MLPKDIKMDTDKKEMELIDLNTIDEYSEYNIDKIIDRVAAPAIPERKKVCMKKKKNSNLKCNTRFLFILL